MGKFGTKKRKYIERLCVFLEKTKVKKLTLICNDYEDEDFDDEI